MVNSKNNAEGTLPDRLMSARGITKSFRNNDIRVNILQGINFDLNSGETVAIVGASGIGKSTLLHILGALDRPDSGTLLYQGEDVFLFDRSRTAKFRNSSIGFVFQFHHLLPEFTALENTMMPALIKGMSKQKAREVAEEILIRVGLKDRLSFRVSKLSGGEQQRVALARSLVLKPVILLADEPTGNLDKRISEKIHALLLELNREFCVSLVVVTHNMDLAAKMSRRNTIIDGKLVELGD